MTLPIVAAVFAGVLLSGLLSPAIVNAALDANSDLDGDGLPYVFEVGPFNSDPSNPDTDGDGHRGLQEYSFGSIPKLPDSDGDGLSDGEEVSNGTHPMDPNNRPPVTTARIIADQFLSTASLAASARSAAG